MKYNIITSVFRSIRYSAKDSIYQTIIVALLAAIITGSLFTGHSVRRSLRKTSSEKLGNADIIISSGLRYFNASLSSGIEAAAGENAVSILESDGYCQNFISGLTTLNVKIYGIGKDFFSFNNDDTFNIRPGFAAVNSKLASALGIKPGDEIIIHFREADPIPSNAPFSPSKSNTASRVMKIEKILTSSESGNFSEGVSQVIPMNAFINAGDFFQGERPVLKANRILMINAGKRTVGEIQATISTLLEPSDIGLSLRKSQKTGETEMISDRIFIDSAIVSAVEKKIPSASPVITYLANSLTVGCKTAPYSFVAALPPSLLPGQDNDGIIINRWLADDTGGKSGDTLLLTWFDPGFNNLLREKSRQFVVSRVIENESKLCDPSLMPDFPGISASTTCSGWDAGIPILMDRIRKKDEAYWNEFRGTPKAFISYKTGKEIWGNNFGPATSLRFPRDMTADEITRKLKGSFEAAKSGFIVADARKSIEKAAAESVDFSTLFLGLGIFIIVSCMILLVLSIEMFFDSRKKRVKTYYYLGFRNSLITKQLFIESAFLSVAGSLAGSSAGYLINKIIITQLNSVWSGAVQTNTLSPSFSFFPLLIGFLSTIIIASVVVLLMIKKFLKVLSGTVKSDVGIPSSGKHLLLLLITSLIFLVSIGLSFIIERHSMLLAFTGGSFLFVSLILLLRYQYLNKSKIKNDVRTELKHLADKYFSFHPGEAITPVILIAAGIFAVIITGANKQVIGPDDMVASGGTGGYLLFAESALPVKENITSPEGRKIFGFDDPRLNDMIIEQAGRVSGDDASCLNLNHVSNPSLLGIDQQHFVDRKSFAFASWIKKFPGTNPWSLLDINPGRNVIYGIADQSVLEWGLKVKTGDTLKYKSETGENLNIVISAGLKPSIFQGYLLISKKNLEKYFPSVAGTSIFLIDGKQGMSKVYSEALNERLSGYGLSVIGSDEKLASFFSVTNTYLEVFTILGIFGMILGIAGLGFVLLRNFNRRKNEFALMLATGYSLQKIRSVIFRDNVKILAWGLVTGLLSALAATLPSLISGNTMPWKSLVLLLAALTASGIVALLLAIKNIRNESLVTNLRIE
jgi:ABC-type antimicrobial peptide transport system permease subunit